MVEPVLNYIAKTQRRTGEWRYSTMRSYSRLSIRGEREALRHCRSRYPLKGRWDPESVCTLWRGKVFCLCLESRHILTISQLSPRLVVLKWSTVSLRPMCRKACNRRVYKILKYKLVCLTHMQVHKFKIPRGDSLVIFLSWRVINFGNNAVISAFKSIFDKKKTL